MVFCFKDNFDFVLMLRKYWLVELRNKKPTDCLLVGLLKESETNNDPRNLVKIPSGTMIELQSSHYITTYSHHNES